MKSCLSVYLHLSGTKLTQSSQHESVYPRTFIKLLCSTIPYMAAKPELNMVEILLTILSSTSPKQLPIIHILFSYAFLLEVLTSRETFVVAIV